MSSSKIKVVVLYGGKSNEHEVSCRSAAFLLRYLDRNKYDVQMVAVDKSGIWLPQPQLLDLPPQNLPTALPIQMNKGSQNALALLSGDKPRDARGDTSQSQQTVLFPMIHGTGGEDGTLQGFMEMVDLPYVGPDHMASAIGMDKIISKKLAQNAGVPVVPWIEIKAQFWHGIKDSVAQRIKEELGSYPVFVKPARLGSSVGINKIKCEADLLVGCEEALAYDDKILIEKGLNAREIEFAALGDYDPQISVAGEVVPTSDFYTYEAKYIDAEGAKVVVPAPLSSQDVQEGQRLAKLVFQALELHGMARIDFFLCKDTGQYFFNEVNTIPGFTSISQYPMLWKASGVSESELLDRLIELALRRYEGRSKLRKTR